MKFLTFAFTIFLVSCIHSRKEEKKEKPFVFNAEIGGFHRIDTSDCIFAKTVLTNNSPDTMAYLSMTCSWQWGYTTDSKYLSIEENICFSNGPMTIYLAPHKTSVNYLTLIAHKPINELRDAKFRMGFNLVQADSAKDGEDAVRRIPDMKNVLWSDTIAIKSLYRFE